MSMFHFEPLIGGLERARFMRPRCGSSRMPISIVAVISALSGCATNQTRPAQTRPKQTKLQRRYVIPLEFKSDATYPDNPDIGHRSALYGKLDGGKLRLTRRANGHFDFEWSRPDGGLIALRDIDLLAFMPAVPPHLRAEDYLAYLAIINQEWNRQQVRFPRTDPHLVVGQKGFAAQRLARVDLARNCLNAGLWEIFLYERAPAAKSSGQVYAHAWFDFPRALYAELFERKNKLPYARFAKALERWVDPPRKVVPLERLRRVVRQVQVKVRNERDAYYPLHGERAKKRKNIITPKRPSRIADFLTDSTRFATFTPPGIYTRADPRKTELGRFGKLTGGWLRSTVATGGERGERLELELRFDDGKRRTRLIIGGLDLARLPRLTLQQHARGWQMPMGIANHTFYATYADTLALPSARNPYIGLLLDGKGRFLDSHRVGIDGPLIYRDAADPTQLHVWLLSFERHALVGHFVLPTTPLAQPSPS